MKFVIESLSKCSPRLGYLQKNDVVLRSPILLQHTKCAIVPFLSQEVFSYVTNDPQAFSICLDSTMKMGEALAEYKKGIASFAGLRSDAITFLTPKNPSEVNRTADTGDPRDCISIYSRTGRTTVTADQYMDLVALHQPDIFHALCDGDTNESSSNKRVTKSVERSETFLRRCAERYKNSETLKGQSLFVAPVEGGYSLKYREKFINEVLGDKSAYDGYFLDGLHSNGTTATSLHIDNIKDIVQRCNELLPVDKFRIMLGPYNPVVLMQLVNLGVDVFDSSYCYIATKHNCALTFSFGMEANSEGSEFDMDLSDPSYKEDLTPILQGCECLACQKHTRAYVHHLINTKELLSSILLMIHNTHHYMELFNKIRQVIPDGNLAKLIDVVRTQMEKGCLLDAAIQKQIELEKENKNKKSTKATSNSEATAS